MMLSFETGPGLFDRLSVNAAALVLVAFLMISRLPTFSLKQVHIAPNFMLPALLMVGLLTAALVSAPWMTFACVGVAYLATIPVVDLGPGRPAPPGDSPRRRPCRRRPCPPAR